MRKSILAYSTLLFALSAGAAIQRVWKRDQKSPALLAGQVFILPPAVEIFKNGFWFNRQKLPVDSIVQAQLVRTAAGRVLREKGCFVFDDPLATEDWDNTPENKSTFPEIQRRFDLLAVESGPPRGDPQYAYPRFKPDSLSKFDLSAEVQKLKFTDRIDELVLVYGEGYVPWKEGGKDPTVSLWLGIGVLDMHSGALVLFYYCEGDPELNNFDQAADLLRKGLRGLPCPTQTKPATPDGH
jgi:hypothetical protein